ncbi:MAG: divergent PAP2 family protein [Eubacteriales bacterium]
MNWLSDLICNPFLVTGITAWLIAQVLKTLIHLWIYKKFDIHRLFGDGGMPSGHSATVTSLVCMAGLIYGTGSFEFAVSAILAIIVCHDAMGVRLETGKQAAIINDLVEIVDMLSTEKLTEVRLKEFVGHTPIQVFAGILVGAAVAGFMYICIF